MRSFLLILSAVCLAAVNLNAQIILTQSSYPASVLGADSIKQTIAASPFPALPMMPGGIWDLSSVTDSVPTFYEYRIPATGYEFADSNQYRFNVFDYQGNVQTDIISDGIVQYGIKIKRSPYCLLFLTGMLEDSFIVNAQNVMYSSPRKKIAFPATIGSVWSSSYWSDLAFELTFLLHGDTMAPGIIRTYVDEKDSVVGWGKMRVKDASGSPSMYLNVLQVQTRIVRTDSFFINGAPFTPVHLATFNLTQGQKDTVYEQNYYRMGELTPLAQVSFSDAAYTQPYRARTHVQRLEDVSVNDVASETGWNVYPNPVRGRNLYVESTGQVSNCRYELVGVTGQVIALGGLMQMKTNIVLPLVIAPGIYFLRVYEGVQLMGQKAVEIN